MAALFLAYYPWTKINIWKTYTKKQGLRGKCQLFSAFPSHEWVSLFFLSLFVSAPNMCTYFWNPARPSVWIPAVDVPVSMRQGLHSAKFSEDTHKMIKAFNYMHPTPPMSIFSKENGKTAYSRSSFFLSPSKCVATAYNWISDKRLD